MKKVKRSAIALTAVLMALCLLLCSCELPFGIGGKTNNAANTGVNTNTENTEPNANDTNNTANTVDPVPPEPEVPMLVQKLEDVAKWAYDSYGIWELMGYMFPDYAVYRISGEGYKLIPANKDLPQNKYDWTRSAEALKGIDVSVFQGDIDWAAVAASGEVHFAFIRLGYRGYKTGKFEKDRKFDFNANGATASGIPIGIYFLSKAINTDEAREEAEWVLDNIKGYDVTWPVVLDFEPVTNIEDRTYYLKPEETSAIINAFFEKIEAAGYTPMIYANVGTFMTAMDINTVGQYDKWFAQYFNSPHFPYAFQIWQATSEGSIPGINANVDIDYAMFNYSTGEDVIQDPVIEEDPQADRSGR